MPRVVHTDPELAHVGLTEAQAAKRHRRLAILRWPYAENDRARAERRTEGHIKVVAARNGDILGVTIAGASASELIGIWTLALSKGLGLKDMATAIPPHPTFGEIGKSAAITYFAGGRTQFADARHRAPDATFRLRQSTAAAEDPSGMSERISQAPAKTVDEVPSRTVPLARGLSTKLLLLTVALRADRRSADLRAVDRQFPAALAGGAAGHRGRGLRRAGRGRLRKPVADAAGRRADVDRRQGDRRARRRRLAPARRRRDAARGRRAYRPRQHRSGAPRCRARSTRWSSAASACCASSARSARAPRSSS